MNSVAFWSTCGCCNTNYELSIALACKLFQVVMYDLDGCMSELDVWLRLLLLRC